MLACARHRRRALGGVRRLRAARARGAHRRRAAEGHRGGVLRHRAEPGRGVQADARPGARARRAPARTPCVVKQRPQAEADLRRAARRRLGPALKAGRTDPAECVEVAATDPLYVLYTSGTTGKPKGIVRDNGGHAVALAWSLPNIYDVARGPGVVDRLRRRLGRRPLLHRLRAADRRRDDGALRGQAGRHAGRRRVLAGRSRSTASRRCSPPPRRSGRSRRRTPTAQLIGRSRPVRLRARCSWPASGSTPTPTTGPPSGSASRSSTTGGRPRPAGRSPRTCAGSSRCRSRPARRPCRCRATTCEVLDEHGDAVPTGRRGRDLHPAAAAPRHAADAVGRRRAVRVVVPLGLRRLLPLRRRRVRRRGRLPVRDGPHRRRHQRRRAPALDRLDGGRPRRAPGGRGVRGDRRRRRAEGPGPARLRGAQGRRRAATPTSSRAELVAAGARRDRRRSRRSRTSRSSPALPKTRSGKILRKTMREIADGKDAAVPVDDRGRRACWTPLRPALRRTEPASGSGGDQQPVALAGRGRRDAACPGPAARARRPARPAGTRGSPGPSEQRRVLQPGRLLGAARRPRRRW